MAKFFTFYPKTVYTLQDNKNSLDFVTNITTNFTFLEDILESSSNYYEYNIGDGDSPENLSHKIYGNPEYHWIILKTNNIMDVKTDWPVEYTPLVESINVAYSTSQYADTSNTSISGLQWAKTNIHSYYKIVTKTVVNSQIIEVNEYRIDSNAYTNLISETTPTFYTLPDGEVLSVLITKDTMTYYDYEIEQNESKRNIKILKPEFVPAVDSEFRKIMVDNV